MLIIVDKRLSSEAQKELTHYGEVLLFGTEHITYEAVSCHPDVFICFLNGKLIVAPNCPDEIIRKFSDNGIQFLTGVKPVGGLYPESALYNATITDNLLIHNLNFTDKSIFENAPDLKHINVNQAYTRCNLLHITENNFITSDRGIEKKIKAHGFNVLYVNPEQIVLPGFNHGFFGGCCGKHKNCLFINGNLKFIQEEENVRELCHLLKFEIIELTKKPLFDIGSILFIQEEEDMND